jgi:hypothetical protein
MIGKSFRTLLIILNENSTHEMEHWDVRMAFTGKIARRIIHIPA